MEIRFETGFGDYEIRFADGWKDLSRRQATEWLAHVLMSGPELTPYIISRLLALPAEVRVNIEPEQWQAMAERLAWLKDVDAIDSWKADCVTLTSGAEWWVGSRPDFSDMTYLEWVYADTLAVKRMWRELAACLCRPLGGRLERERFTLEGMERRHDRLQKDWKVRIAEECYAVCCNFVLLRKRFVSRWPRLFSGEVVVEGETVYDAQRGDKARPADWLKLLRLLLGANFYEEQKALELPVAAVLERMNAVVANQ